MTPETATVFWVWVQLVAGIALLAGFWILARIDRAIARGGRVRDAWRVSTAEGTEERGGNAGSMFPTTLIAEHGVWRKRSSLKALLERVPKTEYLRAASVFSVVKKCWQALLAGYRAGKYRRCRGCQLEQHPKRDGVCKICYRSRSRFALGDCYWNQEMYRRTHPPMTNDAVSR